MLTRDGERVIETFLLAIALAGVFTIQAEFAIDRPETPRTAALVEPGPAANPFDGQVVRHGGTESASPESASGVGLIDPIRTMAVRVGRTIGTISGFRPYVDSGHC